MVDELGQGPSQVALSKWNHTIRHSPLIDRTNRSACAWALGARNGVCTTRTPASSTSRRTAVLHLPSRSQINTRWLTSTPSSAAVRVRPTWRMNLSSGCGVDPTICTRREARSITNTVLVRHQAPQRPDLRREEIRPSIRAPVRPQERLPGGRPLWYRGNAVFFQDQGLPFRKESRVRRRTRMAWSCALGVSVDVNGAGAAAPTSVAASHQSPCPIHHAAQIEFRNLAPVGQHRRPR
jgi:hypothetical protein